MGEIVWAHLGEYRAIYPFKRNGIECDRGDYVVIDVDRGSEYAQIVSDSHVSSKDKEEKLKGIVLRNATEGDLKQIENNRVKAQDAMNVCVRKINDRKLQMKIVKAEYTFDSSKIIFAFTADKRVDFRVLVKDLAKVFRVRIELKQIGVRDKAKIVSGYGVCGRELCCASYMKDFHPLTIKMAKGQGLPLNPSRISGSCGRIKCCMSYEYCVYKDMSKGMPKMGEKITLPEGKGKIIDINILKRMIWVDMGEGSIIKRTIPDFDETKSQKGNDK